MNRTQKQFIINDIDTFKEKIVVWAQQYETFLWLDTNNHQQQYSTLDAAIAIDAFTSIKTDYYNAFDKLKEYQSTTNDYIFGYISYDVKNDIENLHSNNIDEIGFADLYFFQPKKLLLIHDNTVKFQYLHVVADEIETDFEAIQNTSIPIFQKSNNTIEITSRISKAAYCQKVTKILNHIKRGDIYEANFCQEFYAKNASINPLKTFNELNKISKAPFSAFFKIEEQYVLSASPERYLKREANKVISQPIKGTAKRFLDKEEDFQAIQDLKKDTKEQAENVMIVDLVRNDLSITALRGSVKVEELCKVYSYEQVHQMVSTVVSEVSEKTHSVAVLKTTFPMGSMTGAPKIAAMNIIETYEETKRGVYSGAIGYFTPKGDVDFNVVIRSILYNEASKTVSFSVGSAITSKAIPEKEYEECLLKAAAMKKVLLNSDD